MNNYVENTLRKGLSWRYQKEKQLHQEKECEAPHHALNYSTFVECSNCGELKLAHHICNSCGFYNKKEVVNKTEEIDEKELEQTTNPVTLEQYNFWP